MIEMTDTSFDGALLNSLGRAVAAVVERGWS
jgi:hypothetical protein